MILRPADETGDILPVLAAPDLLGGAAATAQLIRHRLDLLTGDWWENAAWGNAALEMLRESRLSEADCRALAAYLTSYIRETPGVREVRDAAFSVSGRQFSYSCRAVTEDGSVTVSYEI